MDEQMIELSKRAVVCKNWRQMVGMSFVDHERGFTWVLISDSPKFGKTWAGTSLYGEQLTATNIDDGTPSHTSCRNAMGTPDLNAPGTRGCLLSLVREAYKQPNAYACFALLGWVMRGDVRPLNLNLKAEDTEVAALVAALEAAP